MKDIKTRTSTTGKGPVKYKDQDLSPGERKVRRAMGRFDRLQSQVDRLEARVRSYEVGGESANVWATEETPSSPEIEAELQQLKNKVAPKEPAKIETDTDVKADTEV